MHPVLAVCESSASKQQDLTARTVPTWANYMETSLRYDQQDKHLSFLLKEEVTADPDIQLRFRGRLNTTTGGFEYHATAQKFVGSGPVLKVRP